MKKILLPVAFIAIATSANAANLNPYVSLKGLAIVSQDAEMKFENLSITESVDESFGLGLAYGIKMSDFRAELELNMYTNGERSYGADEFGPGGVTKISHKIVFLNGYYDIKTNSPFTPYIGAGLGYNYITVKEPGLDDSDSALAANIGVGASIEMTKMMSLDIGYRYMYFGEWSMSNSDVDITFTGHQIYLGARATF